MLDGVVRKIFGTQSRALSLSSQKATYIPVASNIQVITKRPTWLRDGLITCGRGVKSKATFQLQDLPQGVLKNDVETPAERNEAPTYPTVIQQARNNMRKFENSVLLTRVGGFYELYFEHASKYGPLLNLKVAQKRTTAGLVPMAGFPFFQLDRFLKILVQDLNKYVAISEEFANSVSSKVKSGGLLFDRKVTRIVTPGTLVDENFMDPYENNFLLAIYSEHLISPASRGQDKVWDKLSETAISPKPDIHIGLAWIDISTGEFFTEAATMDTLSSTIARIRAREIILSRKMDETFQRSVMSILGQDRHLVTWLPHPVSESTSSFWNTMLETPINELERASFTKEEIHASSMLLEYVQGRLQGLGIKLQPPVRRQDTQYMGIDKNSVRALELLETSRDGLSGGKGSLLHALRRTNTKSGARLLKSRISSPSTSLPVINQRLDLVEHFLHNLPLREAIINLLRRTYDSQRLVQKFSLGRGDADDLISLSRTIEATVAIFTTLERYLPVADGVSTSTNSNQNMDESLRVLMERLSIEGPDALAKQIVNSIDEDGLSAMHQSEHAQSADTVRLAQHTLNAEGSNEDLDAMSQVYRTKLGNAITKEAHPQLDETWIMCRSASSTLERLHKGLDGLCREQMTMTTKLRDVAGTPNLSLRWTPGLGHICHVKGAKDFRKSTEAFPTARNVNSTKSTRSFYLPEWSSLGARIDQIKIQIRAEEQRVFQGLRKRVVLNLVKLRRNAAVLDELDLACSFTVLAEEQRYVRPILNKSTIHTIIGGRHPTVKLGLEEQGRAFVSNDCFVGKKAHIWLLTGPNMAGKSTYLRQNALISILAQMGSFVPAEHAEIGVVDHVFSRVGSADNLFQDQSTFMVEMLETAAILKQATPRSFVIMDEVGRGTTPQDGIAVGFACLHHLYHTNKCRSLFATHFHALTDMTRDWSRLACYCTDVTEGPSGSFYYDHQLREGVNRQSHALKVARLAGIPEPAINVAMEVLNSFEQSQSCETEQSPALATAVR